MCVWYLKPKSKGKFKGENRWRSGIWLGIRDESGEYIIGAAAGVCKVRTLRRKGSAEERWNWEELNSMQGLPWEPVPGKPGTEMTTNIGAETTPRALQEKTETEEKEVIQRAFRVSREEVRAA